MTAAELVVALDLPTGARVDRRVPKTLLVEHGTPTSADRRLVNEKVETLIWHAVLKPATIGVAAFRDEVREYLEVIVLTLVVRDASVGERSRLIELVHRAVPYPVILLTDDREGESLTISAAHIRQSAGEAGKTVLDGSVVAVTWSGQMAGPTEAERTALSLARQPHATMWTLYDGWRSTLTSILAARITGAPPADASPEQSADRERALAEWREVEREIDRVRSAARREKQMARQVELNVQLKALEARRVAVRERLQ